MRRGWGRGDIGPSSPRPSSPDPSLPPAPGEEGGVRRCLSLPFSNHSLFSRQVGGRLGEEGRGDEGPETFRYDGSSFWEAIAECTSGSISGRPTLFLPRSTGPPSPWCPMRANTRGELKRLMGTQERRRSA